MAQPSAITNNHSAVTITLLAFAFLVAFKTAPVAPVAAEIKKIMIGIFKN